MHHSLRYLYLSPALSLNPFHGAEMHSRAPLFGLGCERLGVNMKNIYIQYNTSCVHCAAY